ncbi:MAG: hypothetical protein AAFR29_07710 [Pseudomonadota bacterium]
MPQRNLNPKWDLGAMSYRELLAARARLEKQVHRAQGLRLAAQKDLLTRIESALEARRERRFERG